MAGLSLALERGDVLHELIELLGVVLLHLPVGRHRRRGVHERARDGVLAEPRADIGEARPERVAVLTDLVAAEATRGGRDRLALLEPWRRGLVDLRRRAGEGAQD